MPRPTTCPVCSQTFAARGPQRFCSRACFHAQREPRGKTRPGSRVTVTCKGCAAEFVLLRHRVQPSGNYCSHPCYLANVERPRGADHWSATRERKPRAPRKATERDRQRRREWARANADRIREYHRERRRRHADRINARVRERYASDPGFRAKNKAWSKQNPAKGRAFTAKWKAANPTRWRVYAAANRSAIRATQRRWAAENPDAVVEKNQRRRARLAAAPGAGVSRSQWRGVREMYGGRCCYCGRAGRVTMDHIDPLARGGAHDVSNVAPACLACNSSKNSRSLLLWLAAKPPMLTVSGGC